MGPFIKMDSLITNFGWILWWKYEIQEKVWFSSAVCDAGFSASLALRGRIRVPSAFWFLVQQQMVPMVCWYVACCLWTWRHDIYFLADGSWSLIVEWFWWPPSDKNSMICSLPSITMNQCCLLFIKMQAILTTAQIQWHLLSSSRVMIAHRGVVFVSLILQKFNNIFFTLNPNESMSHVILKVSSKSNSSFALFVL